MAHRIIVLAITTSLLIGCAENVAVNLSQAKATSIATALDKAGLSASVDRSKGNKAGFNVAVLRSQVSQARSVITDGQWLTVAPAGYDSMSADSSLIRTPTQDRVLREAAIAGELEKTLNRWPTITRARVHLSIPEKKRYFGADAVTRPKASVFAEHGKTTPSSTEIKALIAGAVDGLVIEGVEVVLVKSQASQITSPAQLANLGPFSVASGSLSPLRMTLFVLLITNLILGAALVFTIFRKRSVA